MEHNYNPGENSKQSCGKSEISKIDGDKYNLVFNTTWKYRGKTTSKPYKQCKMSVAACIEAASYFSGFRPCKSASPQYTSSSLPRLIAKDLGTGTRVSSTVYSLFCQNTSRFWFFFFNETFIWRPYPCSKFPKNRANRPRQLRSYWRNG